MSEGRSARRSRRRSAATATPVREVNYHSLKNPFPPMRVFSDDRIEAMHEASLEVLENLGVKVLLPEARDLLIAGGATLKGEDMVHIDREMVTAALAPLRVPSWGTPGVASAMCCWNPARSCSNLAQGPPMLPIW